MNAPPRHRQRDGRVHAVAVACARGDGRWLLIRRSRHVRAPRAVAFPGGALEAGETQAEAVVREMREELGIEVEPRACFWSHAFEDRPLVLWGWYATFGRRRSAPGPVPGASRERLPDGRLAVLPVILPGTGAEAPPTVLRDVLPPLVPDPSEVEEVLWLSVAEATAHPDRTPQMESFLRALEAHLGGASGMPAAPPPARPGRTRW